MGRRIGRAGLEPVAFKFWSGTAIGVGFVSARACAVVITRNHRDDRAERPEGHPWMMSRRVRPPKRMIMRFHVGIPSDAVSFDTARPRTHLAAGRIRLEDRFMESDESCQRIALIVSLDQGPGDVGDLRLDVAGILEQVRERKKQLRLHVPD
jgi:hypothetical protein